MVYPGPYFVFHLQLLHSSGRRPGIFILQSHHGHGGHLSFKIAPTCASSTAKSSVSGNCSSRRFCPLPGRSQTKRLDENIKITIVSFEFQFFCLIFLFCAPVTAVLIPCALFALLHAASYTITLLDAVNTEHPWMLTEMNHCQLSCFYWRLASTTAHHLADCWYRWSSNIREISSGWSPLQKYSSCHW